MTAGELEICCVMKLQEERCEQWVSDAGKVLWIVLGDFASLIRLSITIRFGHKLTKRENQRQR
jgi:hypothetical protein